jgi:hypothetical protein
MTRLAWIACLPFQFGRSVLSGTFLYRAANLPGSTRHAGTSDKNNTATLYEKRHEPHRTEFLDQNVFKIVLDIRP